MAATKRGWVRPTARPLTTVDSRADVPDSPVQNGTPTISTIN
jgi:hypothetical protein